MPETAEDKLNALVARVGHVRRWLATLAILKVTALCLVFVSLYVGVYAWLDHRLNFDETGRIAALVLLVAGIAVLLRKLTKLLLGRISASGAASYIENERSFDQQLVTAIEYHENKQDYPYSKALVEQVVLQVDKDSREFRFDSTVKKWHGYALAAVILLGLVCAWFYVRANAVYFSLYFARLTRPVAIIAPLPATTLESVTKDIVAATDSEVILVAEVQGRVPESGKLVLADLESEDGEGEQAPNEGKAIEVEPVSHDGATTELRVRRSFSQPGLFKYRFEAGSASMDWHRLSISRPAEIENIKAEVMPPRNPSRRQWLKPYTEHIEANALEVIPGSSATLHVQSTEKLKEVTATGPDGKPITRQLDGAEQFTFHLNADRNGTVKFRLVNEQGLVNDEVPELQVIVKTDEPPRFKLTCPDGDYLATDVASVPIVFEVTDDFGLDSVRMCLEIPGRQPQTRVIPIEEGTRSATFTHTVELEEYELTVGDSILFHAEATDMDTGSALGSRTSSSDIYFIEIRPYRQNWRRKSAGGPGQTPGLSPVELLNILEYTRAIVKKTWDIARKPSPKQEDLSALDFMDNDIRYCAEQLAMIRDDPDYGFDDSHKAVLNKVLTHYAQASTHLAEHDAALGLVPEKEAYRILRRFILELDLELKPPSAGQSPSQEKPDSVKLQEQPEFAEYETERIESELRQMQQELDKLTQNQGDLAKTFENLLREQAAQEKATQEAASDRPPADAGEQQNRDIGATGSPGNGSAGQKAGQPSDNQTPSQGQNSTGQRGAAAEPQSVDESGQAGSGRGRTDGYAPGGGRRHTADAGARLKMIQARQRALQEQVAQLSRDLSNTPAGVSATSDSGGNQGRAEAQKHLDEAVKKMADFQARLAEARYRASMQEREANEALETIASAGRELDLAGEAIGRELTMNDNEQTARKAREMAEQLADAADALDESVTAAQREDMLARLEEAKRLLETMPEPQWTQVGKAGDNRAGARPVLTTNPNLTPAQQARQMARQFFSIAVHAKRRRPGTVAGLTAGETSDVKFRDNENNFFENAAKFDEETMQK